MGRIQDNSNFVKTLIVQWYAFAKVAIVLARDIWLLEKFDPRRAAYKAEMLEVWLRFSLFNLVAQVAALHAEADDPDDPDIHYLHKIAVCLSMVLVIVGHLKRKCLRRQAFILAPFQALRCEVREPRCGYGFAPCSLQLANGYFDSS